MGLQKILQTELTGFFAMTFHGDGPGFGAQVAAVKRRGGFAGTEFDEVIVRRDVFIRGRFQLLIGRAGGPQRRQQRADPQRGGGFQELAAADVEFGRGNLVEFGRGNLGRRKVGGFFDQHTGVSQDGSLLL